MKIMRLVYTLFFICLLTGCGSMENLYDNDYKIASNSNSYSFNNVKQEVNDGTFHASIEEMEGMETVWTMEATETTNVDFTYAIKVYSGKVKLVLISPKEELTTLTECTSDSEANENYTISVHQGENRMKIVAAQDTKFDITLSVTDGNLHELGF